MADNIDDSVVFEPECKSSAALTIAICNFNTTDLTNNAIASILQNLPSVFDYRVVILDNSDTEKFKLSTCNSRITVFDNTESHYVDFDRVVSEFCKIPVIHSNNGSLKHCFALQWLINACQTPHLMIADSDITVKHRIDFINPCYLTVAAIQKELTPNEKDGVQVKGKLYAGKTRFLPYLQYINCSMLKQTSIAYFDPTRMHGGLYCSGHRYDTGASFYEDVIAGRFPYYEIAKDQYLTHLGAASWKKFDVNHLYTN